MSETKHHVLYTISDLVADFVYYDRKEDEDLPVGEIERLVESGDLTVDEMVEAFREYLEKVIQ